MLDEGRCDQTSARARKGKKELLFLPQLPPHFQLFGLVRGGSTFEVLIHSNPHHLQLFSLQLPSCLMLCPFSSPSPSAQPILSFARLLASPFASLRPRLRSHDDHPRPSTSLMPGTGSSPSADPFCDPPLLSDTPQHPTAIYTSHTRQGQPSSRDLQQQSPTAHLPARQSVSSLVPDPDQTAPDQHQNVLHQLEITLSVLTALRGRRRALMSLGGQIGETRRRRRPPDRQRPSRGACRLRWLRQPESTAGAVYLIAPPKTRCVTLGVLYFVQSMRPLSATAFLGQQGVCA